MYQSRPSHFHHFRVDSVDPVVMHNEGWFQIPLMQSELLVNHSIWEQGL
jgi:hypothetical protein